MPKTFPAEFKGDVVLGVPNGLAVSLAVSGRPAAAR